MADSHEMPLARAAQWVERRRFGLRWEERGTVTAVGDGIARIKGLPSAAMDDLLIFDDGSRGTVFDLAADQVGVVLLDATDRLAAGVGARLAGEPLSVPVGDTLLGRVVNPLGVPLDGLPPPKASARYLLERRSPPMTIRQPVHEPLYTGIKIVDALIPIGKGQRQLLIGDEGVGRSAIAVDTVINQKDHDVLCVYVLIGQKRSTVINTIETLRRYGALPYTTVVVSEASVLPGLQHIAPFAGCAIAEHWMTKGHDTLIIYDDLSTHARTYRELSLLLRRPPGREAYPGDIFSIHARLLERSTCLDATQGGGSMTALPVVETQEGEIAAFIPTNLISITDGQLYLDSRLFAAGFRPAIDIAKSVSRIGGAAQHPRIKEEAARVKLDYLQFLDLEVFTRFATKLEPSMEASIRRGRVLRELLKQDRLSPVSPQLLFAWLVAFNDARFDRTEPEHAAAQQQRLVDGLAGSSLTLDSPRGDWARAVAEWLGGSSP